MADTTVNRCRLCLVTPAACDPEAFLPDLAAAVAADDVASLIVTAPGDDAGALTALARACAPVAQAHGVAVVVAGDVETARGARADGIQTDAGTDIAATRTALGDGIVGLDGLATRHAAMTAGETGPDYLFFGRLGGDDRPLAHDGALALAAWWSDVAVVPAVVMGGHDLDSAAEAAHADIAFVALRRAVWDHPHGPAAAVAAANARLKAHEVAA